MKSIPSTCGLPALFETDERGSTHKSAWLRYLQPTWGEIYDGWRLESIYRAFAEGEASAGGGDWR